MCGRFASCAARSTCASGFQDHLTRRAKPPACEGYGQRIGGTALLAHIRAIFTRMKGANGWPRVWRELGGRSIAVAKGRVRKMMKADGLRARGKRKFRATTESSHKLPV